MHTQTTPSSTQEIYVPTALNKLELVERAGATKDVAGKRQKSRDTLSKKAHTHNIPQTARGFRVGVVFDVGQSRITRAELFTRASVASDSQRTAMEFRCFQKDDGILGAFFSFGVVFRFVSIDFIFGLFLKWQIYRCFC